MVQIRFSPPPSPRRSAFSAQGRKIRACALQLPLESRFRGISLRPPPSRYAFLTSQCLFVCSSGQFEIPAFYPATVTNPSRSVGECQLGDLCDILRYLQAIRLHG